jgi:hypothetical protein
VGCGSVEGEKMLFSAVSGQRSVVKDRDGHSLLIALIVRRMMEIICNLPGPQMRGTVGTRNFMP